jgi:hypothetical protein
VYVHEDDPATHAVAVNESVSTADPERLKPVTEMLPAVKVTFPPAEELPTDLMSHPAGAESVNRSNVLDDGVIENENDPFVPPGLTPPVSVAVAVGAAADAEGAIRIATPAITIRTTVARMVRKRLCFIFRSFLSV